MIALYLLRTLYKNIKQDNMVRKEEYLPFDCLDPRQPPLEKLHRDMSLVNATSGVTTINILSGMRSGAAKNARLFPLPVGITIRT